MNNVLKKQLQELNKIEKKNERKLKNTLEGSLYAIKNKNSFQYYWRKDDGTETYINKKNRGIVKKLAQK